MKNNKIEKVINKGLEYLAGKQNQDGSFDSFVSWDEENFSKPIYRASIFPTCLVLSCINNLRSYEISKKVAQKSATFLLLQKSDFWSFNYWKRNSKEATSVPYPDDLDDTCCALAGLSGYDDSIINSDALALIIQVLTETEIREGGPYITWLVPKNAKKKWRDVDLAVNSNVGFFLSMFDVSLKSINNLIENAIEKKYYYSPYYVSQYSVVYFISRYYKGSSKKKIIEFLLNMKKNDASWGNPMDTALAISALMNFGFMGELEKSIAYLLSTQCAGAWKSLPFIVEEIKYSKKLYAGSAELTTAFCLEALSAYFKRESKKEAGDKQNKHVAMEFQKIQSNIENQLKKRFSLLSPVLEKTGNNIAGYILRKDKNVHIATTSCIFSRALKMDVCIKKEKELAELGLANLYGWIAYTVYDDFFDDEGDIKSLSLANVCLREMAMIFGKIFEQKKSFDLFERVMDDIDNANDWEVRNCRALVSGSKIIVPPKLPDYGDLAFLADRSMGHALGPIAILLEKYDKKSKEIKNLERFFRHYIIARQLNDDMHDWEDDFKRGQLSSVVVALIKKGKRRNMWKREIDLEKKLSALQELFWHEIVSEICESIIKQLELARKYANQLKIIINEEFFCQLIDPLQKMAEKTKKEQREMVDFLKAYAKK